MKAIFISIVIGVFSTVLLKEVEEMDVGKRMETIKATAFLRTAIILRRVMENSGELLSLKLL